MNDPFLLKLVLAAESRDHENPLALTVCVGGVIISGEIVSTAKYFELLGAAKTASELEIGDVRADGGPYYLHLSGAKFWLNSQESIPTTFGVLWRGQLDRVDGFHIGEFTIARNQLLAKTGA